MITNLKLKDVEIVKMNDIELQNNTPNILIDDKPFSVVVDSIPSDIVDRKPSVENINLESPFETDNRFRYEVTRFLTK